jgi:hypothetical protein
MTTEEISAAIDELRDEQRKLLREMRQTGDAELYPRIDQLAQRITALQVELMERVALEAFGI